MFLSVCTLWKDTCGTFRRSAVKSHGKKLGDGWGPAFHLLMRTMYLVQHVWRNIWCQKIPARLHHPRGLDDHLCRLAASLLFDLSLSSHLSLDVLLCCVVCVHVCRWGEHVTTRLNTPQGLDKGPPTLPSRGRRARTAEIIWMVSCARAPASPQRPVLPVTSGHRLTVRI